MTTKYNIGGCATVNGVIMINSSTGRAAKAIRGKDGTILIEQLVKQNKVLSFYKLSIEKRSARIPAIREVLKMLLMLFIVIESMLKGILDNISSGKNRWFKKAGGILLFFACLYVFLFLNDVYGITLLILLLIIFNKRVKVILKYHGAEHKCVNLYEKIENLDDLRVENAREFSRIHFRCGTNIIFILIPLSLLYYYFAESYLVSLFAGDFLDILATLLLMGIAIEFFRWFQKPLMRYLLSPGLFLQKLITTKEPDDSQLEVAIEALKAVL